MCPQGCGSSSLPFGTIFQWFTGSLTFRSLVNRLLQHCCNRQPQPPHTKPRTRLHQISRFRPFRSNPYQPFNSIKIALSRYSIASYKCCNLWRLHHYPKIWQIIPLFSITYKATSSLRRLDRYAIIDV